MKKTIAPKPNFIDVFGKYPKDEARVPKKSEICVSIKTPWF